MKNILFITLSGLALAATSDAAIVLNDGTTTTGLTTVTTAASTSITPDSPTGRISVGATAVPTNYARARGALYTSITYTNSYTVTADFANSNSVATNYGFDNYGGVIGNYDPTSKTGIGIYMEGAGSNTGEIKIHEFDFDSAYSGGLITTNFRNADGTDFSLSGNTGMSRADATFSLTFAPASAADISNWASATLNITATVTTVGGSEIFSKTFLAGTATPSSNYVGYLFGTDNGNNPAPTVYDSFGSFDNLTLVPEPGTYALFAGFLALGLTLLRRRKA